MDWSIQPKSTKEIEKRLRPLRVARARPKEREKAKARKARVWKGSW